MVAAAGGAPDELAGAALAFRAHQAAVVPVADRPTFA
jgi:hypothetical protein